MATSRRRLKAKVLGFIVGLLIAAAALVGASQDIANQVEKPAEDTSPNTTTIREPRN